MVDHKFNGEASPKYYVSAPTTPIHTGASSVVIPFDWELTPGTPKHSITRERFDEEEDEDEDDPSMEFAFQFNARKEEEDYFSVTADELFEKGKILPLKPPPCLHQYKVSPSLTSPSSPLSRFFFRGGVGGGGGLKAAEKESDPFEKAIEETTRGRYIALPLAPSLSAINMAEPPKVYPLDVESGQHSPSTSKSTAPLMHTPSTRSHHRSSPPPPPNLKRRLPCFCRCICWTVLVVLVFVILIGITLGALYLVYRPKIPDYSIDKLSVQNFAIDDNNTAYAAFDAMITADNPNKKIGIYYVNGSYLSVWYTDIQLCDGKLPVFYQGHRNKTVMNVLMSGETQITDALVGKLNTLRETGSVPLKVKGTVPVKIKFGELKLWKMNFRVRCDIVIDSLSSGDEIRIKSKSCSFKVRLLGIYFGS